MEHGGDPVGGPPVEVHGPLSPPEVADVTRLVAVATAADGVAPVSEHVLLHVRHDGQPPASNLLLRTPAGELAGYAHVDPGAPPATATTQAEGPGAELVVHPDHRRRGYGRALVGAATRESPDGRLRLWAHGALPDALSLAGSLGLDRIRELRQLRRPLGAALPEPVLPPGIRVRTLRPGLDDEEWLALNARAFAGHPEQGGWTLADLHRRMQEPWFDPAGFFLAERESPAGTRLVGFHWTKVHPAGDAEGQAGAEPVGEVYVLGIDPAEQGNGLGRALVLVGLGHLRSLGLGEAMLYVEADSVGARLYANLGFTQRTTDVMFLRRPDPSPRA